MKGIRIGWIFAGFFVLVLKGSFKSNGDKINLYIDTSNPRYIYIYTKDGLTIINDKTDTETQNLYEKLKASII